MEPQGDAAARPPGAGRRGAGRCGGGGGGAEGGGPAARPLTGPASPPSLSASSRRPPAPRGLVPGGPRAERVVLAGRAGLRGQGVELGVWECTRGREAGPGPL